METKFQKWLTAHDPDDNMRWKRSFWDTYVFWRDVICPLFVPYLPGRIDSDIDKNIDWNERRFNKHVHIVGTHWSKSIENPVLEIDYYGVKLVFRYNFYDYELAVIGNVPITLPDRLFASDQFYYQGFPKEYCIGERYQPGATTFICGCGSHYQFYTIVFLIRDCIDKYIKQSKRGGRK